MIRDIYELTSKINKHRGTEDKRGYWRYQTTAATYKDLTYIYGNKINLITPFVLEKKTDKFSLDIESPLIKIENILTIDKTDCIEINFPPVVTLFAYKYLKIIFNCLFGNYIQMSSNKNLYIAGGLNKGKRIIYEGNLEGKIFNFGDPYNLDLNIKNAKMLPPKMRRVEWQTNQGSQKQLGNIFDRWWISNEAVKQLNKKDTILVSHRCKNFKDRSGTIEKEKEIICFRCKEVLDQSLIVASGIVNL